MVRCINILQLGYEAYEVMSPSVSSTKRPYENLETCNWDLTAAAVSETMLTKVGNANVPHSPHYGEWPRL